MSCSGHQTKLGSPPGKGNRNSTSETNMAKSPSAEIDNKTILFWKFFFVARIFHWARWSLLGFIFVNTALYCYFPDIQCIVCIFIYIYLPMFWLYNLIFSMTHVGKYTLYIQLFGSVMFIVIFVSPLGRTFIFSCFFYLPLKLTANSKSPWKWRVERWRYIRYPFCQVNFGLLCSESNYEFWGSAIFWCLPVKVKNWWLADTKR